MTPPPRTVRRATCTHCLRPHTACICHWITPTAHAVQVVILQHPLELQDAKGSARLLHLSLPQSRLVAGEVFDPQVLHDLLTAPWHTGDTPQGPRQAVLLYPQTPDGPGPGGAAAPVALPPLPIDPAQLRLIVLDGTWRKSRKMLALNPLLQHLPRLPLRDMPPSRYLIRRAHRPDQLSTLEAVCAALGHLEASPARFHPLLEAFDGFVAQQGNYARGRCRTRNTLTQPGTHEGADGLALQRPADPQHRK